MSDNKDIIAIAFIGAGYMIREHIQAFASIENTELAGIYSKTKDKSLKLKQEFSITYCCDSIESLYQQTKADLVVIGVSELAAPEIIHQCAKYNWTILAEKPVAYNLQAALDLQNTVGNIPIYVAHNRRSYSSVLGVSSILNQDNGTRVVKIIDQEDTKAALEQGFPELVVENWIYANSIHLIDLFFVFARGAVTNVEKIYDEQVNNSRFLSVKINFDSGDIGIYEANWNAPGPWRVSISTADKYFDLAPIEQAAYQNYGSRQWNPIKINQDDNDYKPGLKKQAELAIKATKGDSSALPSLDQSIKTMHLINQIYG